MCLVLTLSQTFAISGGPFQSGQRVALPGQYAGVMIPAPDPVTGQPDPNSLIVFTLVVPAAGLTTGDVAIFRNGFFYEGNVHATADPQHARIQGGVEGQFTDTLQSGSTVVEVHYFASGTMDARVVARSGTLGIGAVRIRGEASVSYIPGPSVFGTPDPRGDSGGPIPYRIKGFKQSGGI